MDRRDNGRVGEIFDALLSRPSAEQAAYLDEACGGDPALRREVESLRAAHEQAGGFLAEPTAEEPSRPPGVEAPGMTVGRYKLLQLIGEGGFGAVYMAEQQRPIRRRVALKIIKLGMDTRQVVARFEAERQALAMMDHPNIAKVLDAGATEAGRPYFVMELVRGVPITEYCDANHLSTRERLELFVPVCQAVQHAHQKAVIHRDLKPSNILVTTLDGKPVPKVIDFGIAKATDQRLTERTLFTEHRQMIGTPAYMSPEQAEVTAADVDTRSDIYSLGVLLYELLTGTTPFDPKELRSMAYAEIQRVIREVEPPRPSTRLSTLGIALAGVAQHRKADPGKLGQLLRGELDWIVMKAMEKDRTRRYETASGLAADVRRHLENEPVQARPAGVAYKLRKFARRNKVLVGAAAAVVVALLLGTAGTTVGLVRARAAQGRAETAQGRAQQAQGAAEAAKAHALTAKAEAEDEARTSRAVLDYTQRLLLSAQPDPKLNGLDLRVHDMLERAGNEIEATLKGQPEAEIEARVMLARMYFSVSGWAKVDKMVEHFGRAYELARALPDGPESPRALERAAAYALFLPDVGRGPEGKELARRTHDAARRKLGDNHVATRLAAYAVGCALAKESQAERSEGVDVVAPVFEYVIRQPTGASTPELLAVLADFPIILGFAGRLADGEQAARRTLARLDADPPMSLVANLRSCAAMQLARLLYAQGKYDAEATVRAENLAYCERHLGTFHENTQARFIEYMKEAFLHARPGELTATLERRLALARARFAGDDPTLAEELAEAGRAWLQLDRASQALPLIEEAVQMRRRLYGEWDQYAAFLLQSAYLAALGGRRQPADGSFAAQLLCALDQYAQNEPYHLPLPGEATPTTVRHRLTRWAPAAPGAVAEGTLAEAASAPQPAPGLYLLSLETPVGREGHPPKFRDHWILAADWNVSVYPIERPARDSAAQPPTPPAPSQVPLAEFRAPGLAMLGDLKNAHGLPDEYFQLVAQTRVDLPPGRYRFHTRSDDGVRLYVDGRRLIDAWRIRSAMTDAAEVDLAAGPHEVRVEYFQSGGLRSLWVHVEPLAQEAQALRMSSLEREVAGLSPAIDARPNDQALLRRRADALAWAGRFEEAERDFARLIEFNPKQHWDWYRRACMLAYLGREEDYGSLCRALVKQFPGGEDGAVLERVTKSALLLPGGIGGDVPELARRAEQLLARDGENPWNQHLAGLAFYRAGRLEEAIPVLQRTVAAGQTSRAPARSASAEALLAMAHHGLGRAAEARAAIERCKAITERDLVPRGMGNIASPENWLIAHTLRREAEALLNSPRPTTLPGRLP